MALSLFFRVGEDFYISDTQIQLVAGDRETVTILVNDTEQTLRFNQNLTLVTDGGDCRVEYANVNPDRKAPGYLYGLKIDAPGGVHVYRGNIYRSLQNEDYFFYTRAAKGHIARHFPELSYKEVSQMIVSGEKVDGGVVNDGYFFRLDHKNVVSISFARTQTEPLSPEDHRELQKSYRPAEEK